MKRQRLNRLTHTQRTKLNRQLEDAVEGGLIRPGHIEFRSPIFVVRKAYGSLRLFIGYCGLNEATCKFAYPVPRMDDTLDELKDLNFYTHLDLASGFLHVSGREEDVHKTAFQTSNGLMEWVAMPFSLCDAPVIFQRMMSDILRDFYRSSLLSTSRRRKYLHPVGRTLRALASCATTFQIGGHEASP
jgi:hypothetical protein